MAEFKKPYKAVLFLALMFSDRSMLDRAMKELTRKFGPVKSESKEFDFTKFSDYYVPEMGEKQAKKYIVFERLIDRSRLADIRLFTQNLEEKLSKSKKRTVNVDPGYITKDAVVFASLKEKGHKIYLGRGVFADLQALFGKDKLDTFEYTFADLKENGDFFVKVRDKFLINSLDKKKI